MKVKKGLIAMFIAAVMALSALGGCSVFMPHATPNFKPHLISEEEAELNPVRPINALPVRGFTEDTAAGQLEELLEIIDEGYRPDISAANVMQMTRITYNAAVDVLNRYIKNDFDEFERIHAIHDYLAFYIEYDFDLYNAYLSGEVVNANDAAFHLDGVFINKRAVCDGISKAFVLLCGIERIKAYKIEGTVRMYSDANAIPHAWNKVSLGGDFYNVDVTLDNTTVIIADETNRLLHHGFFLISDSAISYQGIGGHTPANDIAMINPDAPYDFGYFDYAENVVIGKEEFSPIVTTTEQLNAIFRAVKKAKRAVGKLELKLDISGEDWRLPSSYNAKLEEAYKLVDDTDAVFDLSKGRVPFLRYPNGVFIMIVYK